MVHSEKRTVERFVVTEVECDCCGRIYDACSYDDSSIRGAGFAKLYGEDEAGFSTHKYTEHACSLECTISLVRRHMSPVVEFPFVWASEKKRSAEAP